MRKTAVVAIGGILCMTSVCLAAEWYVDASVGTSGNGSSWATAFKTIQEGVNAANTEGDTVWVTNGVYDSGGAVAPKYNQLNRVCISNAVTVRSVNGPAVTTIAGAPGSNGSNDTDAIRGVFITGGGTLAGFTITNGYTMTNSVLDLNDLSGGGIRLESGCTASNVVVQGNSAERTGGGAFLYYGGTLNNSSIMGNTAVGNSGGGVYMWYGGTVSNCTITGNSAMRNGGGAGLVKGGVMNNCTLTGNSGNDGGGVLVYEGGIVNNCVISDNSAVGWGGGLYFYNDGTVNTCTISGNQSDDAGGVYFKNGGILNNSLIISNSTVNHGGGMRIYYGGTANNCLLRGNVAGNRGGGVEISGKGELNNCTVTQNESTNYYGGGIYLDNGGNVNNCIVYGNTAKNSQGRDIYNYQSGGTNRNTCASDGVTHGTDGCITNNPAFVNSASGNFQLQSSSPCINAGSNTYAPTNSCQVDLAGHPRIVDDIVDMGAYEWQQGSSGIPWFLLLLDDE